MKTILYFLCFSLIVITFLNIKNNSENPTYYTKEKISAHLNLTNIIGENQTIVIGSGATAFPGKINNTFIDENAEENNQKLNLILSKYEKKYF